MKLTDEIKQTRPFASAAQEAAVSLLRTADVVRRAVGSVVEPLGITPQQYNVLRILRGAGDAGLPTLEIASRMIEQTPGITRLIDRLESKQLVERRRCTSDKRQVFCAISASGLQLLARLDEPLRSAETSALGSLDEAQITNLINLLERARAGFQTALLGERAAKEKET